MNRNKVTGIILAGGKATRMGGMAKGLLKVYGVRCIERVAQALARVAGKTIIIANDNAYDFLGFDVFADIRKGLGPAGGLLTGLTYSATADNLVVACDMPFVNPLLLEYILDQHDAQYPCLVPMFNGRLQPLCAYYAKYLTRPLEKSLEEGVVAMRELVLRFGFRPLPVTADMEWYNNNLFENLNSPQDFKKPEMTGKATYGS